MVVVACHVPVLIALHLALYEEGKAQREQKPESWPSSNKGPPSLPPSLPLTHLCMRKRVPNGFSPSILVPSSFYLISTRGRTPRELCRELGILAVKHLFIGHINDRRRIGGVLIKAALHAGLSWRRGSRREGEKEGEGKRRV